MHIHGAIITQTCNGKGVADCVMFKLSYSAVTTNIFVSLAWLMFRERMREVLCQTKHIFKSLFPVLHHMWGGPEATCREVSTRLRYHPEK